MTGSWNGALAVVSERVPVERLKSWRCPDLDGEVHVWCTALQQPARRHWTEQYWHLLSDEERRRAVSFRVEEGRMAHASAWVLTRLALSSYVSVRPEAWEFARDRGGRPEVAGPPGTQHLRFNVSHTTGLVACAVTWNHGVGVDVENAARPAPLEVADRFFSPEETASARELPASHRARHFFRLWTLKEAYAKARGLGLSLPLHEFTIELGQGSAARLHGDDASRWQLFASSQLRSTRARSPFEARLIHCFLA